MQVTSAQANKILKVLNTRVDTVLTKEREMSTYTLATTEMNDKHDTFIPNYSFKDTQAKLWELYDNIAELKHLINVFNSTQVITSDGCTIDKVLVYLPILNRELSKLEIMKNRLPQKRESGYGNGLIEYTYTNYFVCTAEDKYNEIQSKVLSYQTALDKANSTITFEIPDKFAEYEIK